MRLNADVDADEEDGGFDREFSVRLFVPNIKNYLFVQKVGRMISPPLPGRPLLCTGEKM